MNWKALGMVVFVWTCIIGFVVGLFMYPAWTLVAVFGSILLMVLVGVMLQMYHMFCDLLD